MTRVNVGIIPRKLSDEHLIAEHREIKRLTTFYKNRLKKNQFDDIPENFVLGNGHMRFFLDKGLYTLNRYKSIFHECERRNFKIKDYSSSWHGYKKQHFNDYKSNVIDKYKIVDRISTRIKNMKGILHYYGKPITKNRAIKLLMEK